jgi:methionine-S-sulfoxide reductase
MESAIFAAGCFWGVQYYFDQVPGVVATEAGYTGGNVKAPTYEQVCTHTTGHAEAVRLTFDPEKITYKTLLAHFFRMHDPTQLNRQGPDVGDSYRTAIFYLTDEQKHAAENAIMELSKQGTYSEPIVTEVAPAGEFWPAEDYHQKFAERTGRGMCHIPYEPIPQ